MYPLATSLQAVRLANRVVRRGGVVMSLQNGLNYDALRSSIIDATVLPAMTTHGATLVCIQQTVVVSIIRISIVIISSGVVVVVVVAVIVVVAIVAVVGVIVVVVVGGGVVVVVWSERGVVFVVGGVNHTRPYRSNPHIRTP
jgi:ketopantoate reductase